MKSPRRSSFNFDSSDKNQIEEFLKSEFAKFLISIDEIVKDEVSRRINTESNHKRENNNLADDASITSDNDSASWSDDDDSMEMELNALAAHEADLRDELTDPAIAPAVFMMRAGLCEKQMCKQLEQARASQDEKLWYPELITFFRTLLRLLFVERTPQIIDNGRLALRALPLFALSTLFPFFQQ
uniref:Uncharacterized protein n=1 Tax=Leptocylindrus danicus TaxID=163516 RepID=A0A7S2KPQ9_9STRA|mmetsp:Transcript_25147/g.37589  ORF Transcript_25147/g.37589 Transcript_25147/m.37589 type:complete len:185 (+) Transcript_25147:150-704(+)